jgi:hypothetical protein
LALESLEAFPLAPTNMKMEEPIPLSTHGKRFACDLEEDLSKKKIKIDISDLACRALEIIQHHLMVPDIGWDMTLFEQTVPSLKEDIVKSRLALLPATMSQPEKDSRVHSWREELDINVYRLNSDDVATLKAEVSSIALESLMQTETISHVSSHISHFHAGKPCFLIQILLGRALSEIKI